MSSSLSVLLVQRIKINKIKINKITHPPPLKRVLGISIKKSKMIWGWGGGGVVLLYKNENNEGNTLLPHIAISE